MIGDLFDPDAEMDIAEHTRPHWAQSSAIVFVTFRTHDSLPKELLARWQEEKRSWFDKRGYPVLADFKMTLAQLTVSDHKEFLRTFERAREDSLDRALGACQLRNPSIAQIVADSLLYFDGQRYVMGDFIIMPNHVHLLAMFPDGESMRKQFGSWLHWTARQINQRIGSQGSFWQEEPFDHLVRNEKQYEYLRRYIADNPRKAGLPAGDYHYHRSES